LGKPEGESIPAQPDGLSQIAALLANEGAKLRRSLRCGTNRYWCARFRANLADIGEEVVWQAKPEWVSSATGQLAGGFGHGTAEIA
jgi:hypothetical protein